MLFPDFPELGDRDFVKGVVICKAALFLNPAGLVVAVEIAAPEPTKSYIFKSVADNLPNALGYESQTVSKHILTTPIFGEPKPLKIKKQT